MVTRKRETNTRQKAKAGLSFLTTVSFDLWIDLIVVRGLTRLRKGSRWKVPSARFAHNLSLLGTLGVPHSSTNP